jgi:hypothetical protein
MIPLSKSGKNMAAHKMTAARRPISDLDLITSHPTKTFWRWAVGAVGETTWICESTTMEYHKHTDALEIQIHPTVPGAN